MCSDSTVCNLLILRNIEALVKILKALHKAIVLCSIINSLKPFIDSLVKRIIYHDTMWIVNIIKFMGIILKSKAVGPSQRI